MTRAQLERFDRTADALLSAAQGMHADDVAQLIAAFIAGRPDFDEEAIDRLHSRMIRARLAERMGVAA